jgi:hypothetical protein
MRASKINQNKNGKSSSSSKKQRQGAQTMKTIS